MTLSFEPEGADRYPGWPQKIRVMSEQWLSRNQFCPCCGHPSLDPLVANRPVADFKCRSCDELFELKAFRGSMKRKIVDGAYGTMISRLASDTNPNFLLLSYERERLTVTDLEAIPKQFVTRHSIEPRRPLSATARRAGWQGCNILIQTIPKLGRIDLIRKGIVANRQTVLERWNASGFIRKTRQDKRAWLLAIMACCDEIRSHNFSLDELYAFEDRLSKLYPNNRNIRAKIRQQLQVLRNAGYLRFMGDGHYCRNVAAEFTP